MTNGSWNRPLEFPFPQQFDIWAFYYPMLPNKRYRPSTSFPQTPVLIDDSVPEHPTNPPFNPTTTQAPINEVQNFFPEGEATRLKLSQLSNDEILALIKEANDHVRNGLMSPDMGARIGNVINAEINVRLPPPTPDDDTPQLRPLPSQPVLITSSSDPTNITPLIPTNSSSELSSASYPV